MALLVAESARAAGPLIVSQSGSMEVRQGRAFAAGVVAAGEALEYQWFRNGQPVAGQTSETLLLPKVTAQNAGSYHVAVSNAGGATVGTPIALTVTPAPALGVVPGAQGYVSVPGHLAYYELYLPTAYANDGYVPPVLFTFNPGGGGMVAHFRTVAEEKGWIVVGVAQSSNQQGSQEKMLFSRAVVQHALENLRIDPNRIFAAGWSGGGTASFEAAKIDAPLMAGVLSMGGWLGNKYSTARDMYLSGLLVARANGDSDTGANSWMASDRNHLQKWLTSDKIKDWSFPGGHTYAPESVQREVFDWWVAGTTASMASERDFADEQEALWKARIMTGEGRTVFEDTVTIAFYQPRSPMALAAWRTIDFLFSESRLFLRENPPDFADFPLRNYLAVHLHHALFAFMEQRDPSRMFSGVAAARALGAAFQAVQITASTETGNILRHPAHTLFDDFVLENALYARNEPPLTGDWDGDGRDNYSEFILGASPLVSDRLPSPAIRMLGNDAFAILPGCRSDRSLRLTCMTSSDLAGDWWPESLSSGAWWHQATDDTMAVTKSIGNTLAWPNLFVRFGAVMDHSHWHDANKDGIPYEYQFPEYQLSGNSVTGDLPNLPDARQSTDVPGGPPMYRRYLAAAEIGAVYNRGASLRYHPALAGHHGYLCHEIWMNVPGSSIAEASAVIGSLEPNEVRLITSTEAPWFRFDSPTVMGDGYLERSRGYIIPSTTGYYVFSIAGDNQCELWLSNGSNPANAARIAYVNSWTGYKNFTQFPSQTSAAIYLAAGTSYYVEILHHEFYGEDHCHVMWIPPDASTRVVIPSTNLKCLPAELIGAGAQ